MERYSLIVVTDETAPIRRFDVPKQRVRNLLWVAGIAAGVLLLGIADYVRVRIDQVELDSLRVETAEQRQRIAEFEETLGGVESNLARLEEFERKVRIIANLPGAAASGGEDVQAVEPEEEAVPVGGQVGGQGEGEPPPLDAADAAALGAQAPPSADDAAPARRVGALRRDAERLGIVAEARSLTLAELIEGLEKKRHRLASTPAIWPTKGWLTSRFGYRVSPFTGTRQFHAGIDVAGARGTPIVSPARGKVTFSGKRGPLGKSLIIEHGYGIRTLYGHADELLVKRGDEIERGQQVATLGSTGRSTGPHLHYVVEVDGKAKNPLDYIFD